jgi:predicted dithiol-disulfide oxidoreductase (DUF899 family)
MDPIELAKQIAALEDEIFDKQKQLHDLRRQAPRQEIDNYEFVAQGGQTVTIKQLFGGKDDLIVVHNMGQDCRYCTLWADGFNGVLPHIENRAAFVIISPDDPEEQAKFAESRGWKFTMVSDPDGHFTEDMGYAGINEDGEWIRPGFSAFNRYSTGEIFRITDVEFGPGDVYSGIWHLFEALAEGVDGWEPQFRYK